MSESQSPRHYFELKTTCPLGDCPVTIHGEPQSGDMRIVNCSRWADGHRCRAECAPQVSLEYAIELARRVQEMLEPPPFQRLETVTVSSWMSVSQRVGGDFQAVHCRDRSIWAIQGDVMGKGVNAALLAAYLVGMFDGLVREELPLIEILAHMNRSLAERTRHRPMFSTALAIEVDLSSCQWSFARAGHELPILIRQQGHRCQFVNGHSLPLGIDPDERYQLYSRPLRAGDRLLVYTDGILEAGVERDQLVRKMSETEPPGLPELAEVFPSSPPFRDDVSLMLFCRDPEPRGCFQRSEASGSGPESPKPEPGG